MLALTTEMEATVEANGFKFVEDARLFSVGTVLLLTLNLDVRNL